jgi:hypothetical protein
MGPDRQRRDGGRFSVRLRFVTAVVLGGAGIAAVLALWDWLGADRLGRPWDRAVRGAALAAVFLAAAAVFPRRAT